MSDNRRKILDNMKLEVSEESGTDPEMTNSSLYYKMKALEEAYAELSSRFSEEYFDEIKADYEKKISDAKAQAKLEAFPIGSIYTSTTNTNPSSYIGGKWEAYGSGRTLVGTGSGTDTNSTTNNFNLGTTGGEYNHRLTTNEMPTHAHNNTAISSTISGSWGTLVPGMHSKYRSGHVAAATISTDSPDAKVSASVNGIVYGYRIEATPTITLNNANAGNNQFHNNMQPYIVVYFWKRTA